MSVMGLGRKTTRSLTVVSNQVPDIFAHCSYFAATLAEQAAVPVGLTILKTIPANDDQTHPTVLYGISPGQELRVRYRGTKVTLLMEKVDATVATMHRVDAMYVLKVTTSLRSNVLEAFLHDAAEAYGRMFASTQNHIRIFFGEKYGNWQASGILPKRSPTTVKLAGTLMDDLIEDVNTFRGLEADYVKHGVPYKRVICLHGPPGTGKTSAIFAVASHLNMNIAMLNIQATSSEFDSNVIRLVNEMPPKSVLVIEDVDAMYPSRTDLSKPSPPGLSTVLNVLDGNLRKHGMIVFMTTNHPEHLDAALTRPGRIDSMIHVGFATGSQASELYKLYFPKDTRGAKKAAELATTTGDLRMAELNAHLFAHRRDSKGFWASHQISHS